MKENLLKKSVRFLLLASILLGGASCSKDGDDDEKETEKKTTTLQGSKASTLEDLKQDYASVIGQYPEAKGKFVEAQYELNGMISKLNPDEIRAIRVNYVYYIGWDEKEHKSTTLFQSRDFNLGEVSKVQEVEADSPWFGDYMIESVDSIISLEQAIENVKKSNYEDPQTAYVTLRYPVIEFNKGHALYVFGGAPNRQKHILVDAYTGEVFELK